MGVQSTLRRASEVVYWQTMSKDIDHYIRMCNAFNMDRFIVSRLKRSSAWLETYFAIFSVR